MLIRKSYLARYLAMGFGRFSLFFGPGLAAALRPCVCLAFVGLGAVAVAGAVAERHLSSNPHRHIGGKSGGGLHHRRVHGRFCGFSRHIAGMAFADNHGLSGGPHHLFHIFGRSGRAVDARALRNGSLRLCAARIWLSVHDASWGGQLCHL
jgi:hypothetical protein